MTLRNLIFDWSGTLADDLNPVIAATNQILLHYGREALSRDEFLNSFRLPYTEWYEEVLPEAKIEDLQKLYMKHFVADSGDVTVLPHAEEFLTAARAAGCRILLLTAVPEEHWIPQAEDLNLRHFFDALYTHAVDKREMIEELFEKEGIDRAETAYIGDMVHDIDAGKAAGLLTIATLTGYDCVEKLAAAKPDILVENLSKLTALLPSENTLKSASQTPPPRPVATAGALIFSDEGKALFVRSNKWSDTWGIPGGKIERGETAEQALARETLEETGLSLKGVDFVFVQDCIEPPQFYKAAHFLLFNYIAFTDSTEVTLNDEAQEYKWLTLNEADKIDLNDPTRRLLAELTWRGMTPMQKSP